MTMNTEQMAARLLELEGDGDDPGLIYYAFENYDERDAEARSETALFGDAWAGAREEIRDARAYVTALETEANFLRQALGLEVQR